jgi:hypothetical protein
MYLDNKEKYEYERDILEYVASFWNSEAVASIRDNRANLGNDRFMNDQEFEERIQSGDFMDADKLRKLKERISPTNLNTDNERVSGRSARLPRDKKSISNLINKKFDK